MLDRPLQRLDSVFIPGIYLEEENSPPPKKNRAIPPNGCSKSFFRPGQLITNISRTLSFDGQQTHRKLFVTKQSEGYKFMPKRHRKYIWRQARPGSAGKLVRSPDLLAAMGALLLRVGREGKGAA